ncbi:MAG: hypothetical protein ACYTG6_03990 [Planctomycetota bacterium]
MPEDPTVGKETQPPGRILLRRFLLTVLLALMGALAWWTARGAR